MEDILASIRKIISEEREQVDAEALAPEDVAIEGAEDDVIDLPEDLIDESEDDELLELSEADIELDDSDLKQVEALGEAVSSDVEAREDPMPGDGALPPVTFDLPEELSDDDDILDLDDEMLDDDDDEVVVAEDDTVVQLTPARDLGDEQDGNEQDDEPEERASPERAEELDEETIELIEEEVNTMTAASEKILSADAALKTSSAFDQLAQTLTAGYDGENNTLEGLVRELLRPMMREWLDTHLPDVVKKMVKVEIERLSRS